MRAPNAASIARPSPETATSCRRPSAPRGPCRTRVEAPLAGGGKRRPSEGRPAPGPGAAVGRVPAPSFAWWPSPLQPCRGPLREPCPGAGSSSRAAGGADASVAWPAASGRRGRPCPLPAPVPRPAARRRRSGRRPPSRPARRSPVQHPAARSSSWTSVHPPIPPSERDDASAVCTTTVSWTSLWRSSAAAPFIDCAPACSTSDRFSAAASLLATPPVDETVWLVTESAAAIWPTCADCAAVCKPVPSLRAASCTTPAGRRRDPSRQTGRAPPRCPSRERPGWSPRPHPPAARPARAAPPTASAARRGRARPGRPSAHNRPRPPRLSRRHRFPSWRPRAPGALGCRPDPWPSSACSPAHCRARPHPRAPLSWKIDWSSAARLRSRRGGQH